MAEGNSGDRGRGTLPQRGKVNQVCQQWLVHEDGALAYELQNKEIDFHYGLNRFNRRTVREDIPVARVVQTDEEVRQQQERFQELEALKAQAEEDEEVARRVTQELMSEEAAHRRQRELEDEELARNAQEKEKKKYEKYMEKKRIKELKRERELLEKQLEQHTQDARLVVRSSQEAEVNDVQSSMNDMAVSSRNSRSALNGFTRYMYRVTPSGRIEDEGDFTDFFAVPDNIPEEQRAHLQALQDEELARLLQEQEHKRTKAEVDRVKLKEIEEQDERLAKIIQEQEKLRAKRAKEKRKQQEEGRRQQQQQQMTNPATRPLPDLPGRRNSSDPPVNKSHDHHRLRRESFLQSIDNWSSQQPQSPESEQSTTSSRNSQRHSSRQSSRDPTSRPRLPTPDEVPPQHAMRSVEQWVINSARETQSHQQQRGGVPHRPDEMIPSPSPPGSYHSEDELPYRPPPPPSNPRGTSHQSNGQPEPCYAVSNPIPFNIATAIDPTYRRQASDRAPRRQDDTDIKMPVLSSSMPIPEEFDMEWDPSLRGSLRRPKGSWNPIAAAHYHDQTGRSGRSDSFSDEGPVISPFQPVQGQRRSGTDKQKARKSSLGNSKKDKQGNCKQQ